MSKIISDVLNQIMAEGTHSALDLARAADVSANMIYKRRNDEANLSDDKIKALSQYLCWHRDTRLAACFVSADYEIVRRGTARADGRVDDEMADMVGALGRCVEAHRLGDADAMTAAVEEAQGVLARLKAERDRL